MGKKFLLCTVLLLTVSALRAQEFSSFFVDKTLRLDYIFSGNASVQHISLDELSVLPVWAGRRTHLAELPLRGNGQVTVRDSLTRQVIYRTSFSSLFQEWLEIDESRTQTRSFENTFLVPFPRRAIQVEVTLCDARQQPIATLTHHVSPADILIHRKGDTPQVPYRYLQRGGAPDRCIDLAILAEGYTADEMDVFYRDAEAACQSLFSHEPFKSLRQKFNVVAVATPSADSGVSVPRLGEWKQTAFSSHFSTFYSDRYLTTQRLKAVHDALAAFPYEHVIILANTSEYGGGGIYNSYLLTTAHHPSFAPVVVHEFGHSFAGLADEYFYENDVMTDTTPTDVEMWEPNVTTLVDFDQKWKDMLPQSVPVPTPQSEAARYPVGVYQGGAYSAKGVYRPAADCRMRTNQYPAFCPVCQRAIGRVISFYTE